MLANGLHNKEMAAQLGVSQETVKTHTRRLLKRLGAASRAQAVAIGFSLELLHPSDLVQRKPH
jgi:two-component system nitrate/nitrite response regulator NarL